MIFKVQDSQKDDRLKDNPLVVGDPYIRFYAGFILQANDGAKLGTLCIIDTKPRNFSGFEKESFYNLGMIAQTELQLFIPNDKNSKTRHYISRREF